MKAFVLSIFDGEGTAILAVVLANSSEEALQLLGSEVKQNDFRSGEITVPTKGVTEEVRQKCAYSMFDSIELDEMPLVRPSRLV